MNLLEKLNETTNFLKTQFGNPIQVGVVLGSGLGNFAGKIDVEKEVAYTDIPHFPVSTVKGHGGKLVFGKMGGKTIVALAGRFHFYEGYTAQEVVYPIQVMKMLGVDTVLLSNAAGAVNANYEVGDLMLITDHISFFTPNPLIGKNHDELGTRFPDMTEPYSLSIIAKAKEIAAKEKIKLHEGVYVAVTGPTFETKAEYKLIKVVGGDVVGMSTVQEVIAANHMGMQVVAVSVVTDLGIRDDANVITHEEVLAAAKEAEPKLTTLFTEIIAAL